MTNRVESMVRQEVEALHEFFVGWFSGQLAESKFQDEFLSRFDQGFILIPPAGATLGLNDLVSGVRQGHGTNPNFRIAIRNLTVRRILGQYILATYEEWQRNAMASNPPDNARIATVLFENGARLRWLHVHETSLPDSVARAGPYDF